MSMHSFLGYSACSLPSFVYLSDLSFSFKEIFAFD